MNQGVELLIARMKTNPEEFGKSGKLRWRWATLLRVHDVLLDHPERKILRPISFNREVMRRLLTAYDLERTGGALSRDQLSNLILPELEKIFDETYANYTEELKEALNE